MIVEEGEREDDDFLSLGFRSIKVGQYDEGREAEGDIDDKDRDGCGGDAVSVLPFLPSLPVLPVLPPHNQFDMLHDRRGTW